MGWLNSLFGGGENIKLSTEQLEEIEDAKRKSYFAETLRIATEHGRNKAKIKSLDGSLW